MLWLEIEHPTFRMPDERFKIDSANAVVNVWFFAPSLKKQHNQQQQLEMSFWDQYPGGAQ